MLNLDIKIGQSVELPGVGRIEVIQKSGRQVRLGFEIAETQRVIIRSEQDPPLRLVASK
jgi:hypothetical protein